MPYELTYIIGEKIEPKQVEEIADKIKKILIEIKANSISQEFLGRKKLAYKIAKNEFGTFLVTYFDTEPENLLKILRELKLINEIIRFMITKSKKVSEKPSKIEVRPKKKPLKIQKRKTSEIQKPVIEKIETQKPKEKIAKEIESEEERLKKLDEQLEEILKE